MKEEILAELAKAKRHELTIRSLEERLLANSQTKFTALMRDLNSLEREGRIELTGSGSCRLAEAAALMDGVLHINHSGSGFVDGEDRSVFVPREALGSALDNDEVTVRILDQKDSSGTIIKILKHNKEHLTGNILSRRGRFVLIPDDKSIPSPVELTNAKDFPLVDGHKALLKIVDYGKRSLTGQIVKILGHADDPGTEIEAILNGHEIYSEFPADVIRQCSLLPKEVRAEDRQGRRDLTGTCHITIDGDDAKDFDDAVSLNEDNGRWRLFVSIADVSHYVPAYSPLDNEAYARGTSVYVVDRVVPMLPQILCDDLCSLLPGKIRLTQTCEMLMDKEGRLLSFRIYPSYIRSARRMTYADVNKILGGDPALRKYYADIAPMLDQMRDLALKLRGARYAKGAVDFATDESQITVDKDGKVLAIAARQRGEGERLIEDFMIAANAAVAETMNKQGYPCIYRVHDLPSLKKMREFAALCRRLRHPWKGGLEEVTSRQFQDLLNEAKDSPDYPVLSKMSLRAMAKAKYDPECRPHFGLALDEYLHFTSPIRRYPDLVVSRMLHKYLYGEDDDAKQRENDTIFVEKAAEQSSLRERNAQDAEYLVDELKMAEYMEGRVGEQFTGLISSVTGFGLFVVLPNTIEGLIRIGTLDDDYYVYDPTSYTLIGQHRHRIFAIGQEVKVICTDADRHDRTISFRLVLDKAQSRDKNKNKPKPKSALPGSRQLSKKEKTHAKGKHRRKTHIR